VSLVEPHEGHPTKGKKVKVKKVKVGYLLSRCIHVNS